MIGLVIANTLSAHFFVHLGGQTAVFAAQQRLGLLGHHLVAFAADDVHHVLRVNILAGGVTSGG